MDKTSRIISSYRVLDVLGRGAMGIVYRAEHVSTGELVALKTIGGTTVRILASIRREIMALSRIRHRGIARIVDHGDHDGVPWYAMELLQGRTLRDVIAQQFGAKRSTSGAEAAAPLLDVVHRVCEPLAHLHSHGIIHRDLKPENIYVREDGSVVLVDFGIAVHFGDSREYELGESVLELTGTPEYMAPEQILGRAVDARADLYSLGCILYECLTGRTPFSSLTLGAVVSRQLSARPPPPSQLVPELLPGLDELVSHLLQKRPVDRLGYAEDVAGRLVALGVENEAPASSKARAYVYRPEFVGRTELIERLRRTIRGEATGPRRLLIAGESGVGKTRLLFELATYAAFQDFVVVTAQCVGDRSLGGVRAGIAAPLQPFRSFLERVADACHEGGAPVSERLLGGRVGVLSAYEARIKEVPALKDEPPPVALAPEAAREKVFDSLRETLFAFANGRPLLVVVDDLQWADELTLGFIESLSSDMLEARDCYVVGSYRSEDEDARLRQLAGCADFEKIELSRLGPEAVAEMIAGMLALHTSPREFNDVLYRASDGNPFFVAEFLRAAIDQGVLCRDSSGQWLMQLEHSQEALSAALTASVSVRDLMLRRLADLEPESLILAQSAAVLGREFEGGLLNSMAGANDLALEVLRRRQILEEGNSGRLRFVHDRLRELVYDAIVPQQRSDLHRRAALAVDLEASGERRASALPALAHHWDLAGVPDRAAEYYTLAGDRARDMYANREALAHYGSALEACRRVAAELPDSRARWHAAASQLDERCADLLTLIGRHADARQALERARGGVPSERRIASARLWYKHARTFETEHLHAEALEAYARAERALGSVEGASVTPSSVGPAWLVEPVEDTAAWWSQWVQLQVERVWVHYWRADVEQMTACVDRVRPVIEKDGSPAQRSRLFQALIHNALRRERYAVSAETVGLALTALASAEETSDLRVIAYCQFLLGFTRVFSGDLAGAEPPLTAAIAGAERTGDLALQARALTYATVRARRSGDVARTVELANDSLRVATRLSMHDYLGAARANLAWAAWRGASDQCETHTAAALGHWDQLTPKYPYPFQWLGRLHGIATAMERGSPGHAAAHADVILGPLQHRLPSELTHSLDAALGAWRAGDASKSTIQFQEVVLSAKKLDYI